MLHFRVEQAPFSQLATEFRVALGMSPDRLRRYLGELGCHFAPEDDPIVFFVVREDEYHEMKDITKQEQSKSALLGISPSIALTEEMARHRFEVQANNHNERQK